MQISPLLDNLTEALRVLPGVGAKSAQRMAYHLLQRNRKGGLNLAKALEESLTHIGHCKSCRTFTEEEECNICKNYKRQMSGQLCVVEMPTDIPAIEQTGLFSGRYFVLMGKLSPLDGIGPREIGLDILQRRLEEESFHEVILATNPTIEGEATANYIAEMCRMHNVKVTRIAHGVPIGSELEMVDSQTLSNAFSGRRDLD